MAEAYKCDRCGKYYSENKTKLTGGNCKNEVFGHVNIKGRFNWYKSYDLCDDCVRELFEFLNDKKEVINDDK